MTSANLIPDLKRDEGCKLSAYQDTRGIWTVGYGHAYVHPQTVWTQLQADDMLGADILHTENMLDITLSWWRRLDDVRQDVMVEMGFNMGVTALASFHHTLAAIERGDWWAAQAGMLQSLWARQVGARATRLALQMATGEHQPGAGR